MIESAQQLAPVVGVRSACDALGVSPATLYRRRKPRVECVRKDRQSSPRALSPAERAAAREKLYSKRFVDKPPRQVYAALLDDGQYLCSVGTFYRLLEQDQASRERRNQLRHPEYKKPELLATGPNQVWSWDITKLRGPAKWTHYHLYTILDIYSRYVVGWMLANRESATMARRLIRESVEKQQVSKEQLTLHSDRGPSMSSQSVAQLLGTLGVSKSHSRPHVSNDNPFSESQFKTLKYCPQFPDRFGSHEHALSFCRSFFKSYNNEHYHTGIGLLTPASVHYGDAARVVEKRQSVLQAAFAAHPERFVRGMPKAADQPSAVWINPPTASEEGLEEELPEAHCPGKPDASLTHPRPGYPLVGCFPAEPTSVSPDDTDHTLNPSSLNTRDMPRKIPGGPGDWSPGMPTDSNLKPQDLH